MPADFYTVGDRLAVEGFAVEVRHYTYPSPFEGIVERASHTLSFSLSPKVAYSQCAVIDAQRQTGSWIDVGDVIFVPAGIAIGGRGAGGPSRRLVCNFEPGWFTQVTGHANGWSAQELVAGWNITSPSIKSDLYRLVGEVTERGPGSATVLEALGKVLAVELVRYLEQALQPPAAQYPGLAPWQLRRITDYVESLVEPSPSVERLAQLCNLSARHLQRAFKETTGRTVGDYIRDVRLTRAKSLLTETDLAQKEIAYRLGFATPTSFGVAFVKATGLTPKQFRLRHK